MDTKVLKPLTALVKDFTYIGFAKKFDNENNVLKTFLRTDVHTSQFV